jgi:hypothetical protein
MKKSILLAVFILLILVSCAPQAITEKQMETVKLAQQDLPEGFAENTATASANTGFYSTSLEKVFFKKAPTNKILNSTTFTKDTADTSYGIVSFEYLLTDAEKSLVITETKKQDKLTCCKLFLNVLQGDEASCDKAEVMDLVAVYPALNSVGEASLGCSLTIEGTGNFDIGYTLNRNALSFVFDGFSLNNATVKAPSLIDLKTVLSALDSKVKSIAK